MIYGIIAEMLIKKSPGRRKAGRGASAGGSQMTRTRITPSSAAIAATVSGEGVPSVSITV